jgi:hypothetical protein
MKTLVRLYPSPSSAAPKVMLPDSGELGKPASRQRMGAGLAEAGHGGMAGARAPATTANVKPIVIC